MTDITRNPAGFTTASVQDVFAQVVQNLTKQLKGKGHSEGDIAHLLKQIEAVQGHEQWQGKSPAAIQAGLDKLIATKGRETTHGAAIQSLKPKLLNISSGDILKSLPNVVPGPEAPAYNADVVAMLRNRAEAKPESVVSKPASKGILENFKQLPKEHQLGIGISALITGMSLYSGITSAVQLVKASNSDTEVKPEIPFSAYAMTAAQLMIGVGMAALTHHQYTQSTSALR